MYEGKVKYEQVPFYSILSSICKENTTCIYSSLLSHGTYTQDITKQVVDWKRQNPEEDMHVEMCSSYLVVDNLVLRVDRHIEKCGILVFTTDSSILQSLDMNLIDV